MAGADVAQPKKERKSGTKKAKKLRRVGVRVDLTPMVDVIMLLITFFMLTTVFTTPQTMEINLPPDETPVEVGESSLLTLRVMADGTIYWNMGIERPQAIRFAELRPLLMERVASNPKLITLVKVQRDGTYNQMVDVMDELGLAKITRFSMAAFKDVDLRFIQKGLGS
ncbi:MAG: biopolymer transporter ExbD [Candidatus Eisenbacteria bacterium]|nr:biopolymer transporter ExbD [Candidatus Eisenbacteria bacterium]